MSKVATTAAFLLTMVLEWGTDRPFRLSRPLSVFTRPRPPRPMTDSRYVAAVHDVLQRAIVCAEEHGQDGVASVLRLRLYGREEPHTYWDDAGEERESFLDGRLVAALGLNHVPPSAWGKTESPRVDGALTAWNHLMPRPGIVGSSNNIEPEEFFAAYRLGMLEGLPPLRDEYQGTERILARARRQRNVSTFRWVWQNVSTAAAVGYHSYGDVRRLARAGSRVTWAARYLVRDEEYILPFSHWENEEGPFSRLLDREQFWCDVQGVLQREDFWAAVAPLKAAWKHFHRRIPGGEVGEFLIANVPQSAIGEFSWKNFNRALRFLGDSLEGDNGYRAALGLSYVFGPNFRPWLQYMERRGVSPHDATYWLPTEPVPGFGHWLMNHKDSDLVLVRVAANGWNMISDVERRLPIRELVAHIKTSQYGVFNGPIVKVLASQCAQFGYSLERFNKVRLKYTREICEVSRETVPGFSPFRVGSYRVRRLARDDVRGLFLGDHTNCCQHPGDVGSSCAWHGATSIYGGFVVIEDEAGTIVAQSWVWRDQDALVFDSLEALGDRSKFRGMMREAASRMVGRLGVTQALGGAGLRKGLEGIDNPHDIPTRYSDAHSVAVIAGEGYEPPTK